MKKKFNNSNKNVFFYGFNILKLNINNYHILVNQANIFISI